MRYAALVVAFVLVAALASAQAVINPTAVSFTASADHSRLTKYVIGYFAAGATDPMQQYDLPLGTPDPTNTVLLPISSTPLGFGAYTAKMKACADTICSEWSEASNPFTRAPMPPAAPVLRR
jgi:hypothetical protein